MEQHYIMEGKFIYEKKRVNYLYFIFREKTVEFIRSCLETETAQIGILVSRGFEVCIF